MTLYKTASISCKFVRGLQIARNNPSETVARTILLAEDEAPLRELLCRLLQSRGYEVLSAGDGQEALSLASGHSEPIDLLVADIRMPRMNGLDLYKQLKTERPELRVLFISGYSEVRTVKAPFLRKPFEPQKLLRKVAELLENCIGNNAHQILGK